MPRAPIRRFDDLDQPEATFEHVHVLSNARLVWTDDDAIEADFPAPWTAAPSRLAAQRERRRDFILAHAGVISAPYLAANEVTDPASVTGTLRSAARPPRYGRSVVVEARALCDEAYTDGDNECVGLIDVKGAGVAPDTIPRLQNHRTGILPLPMAFEEVINQRLVEAAMRSRQIDVCGVPVYAVVDLGLTGRIPGFNPLPCAALVRAAHRRPRGGSDLPSFGTDRQRIQIAIELCLRQSGITTVTPMSELRLERRSDGSLKADYAGKPVAPLTSDLIEALIDELSVQLNAGESISFGAANLQLTRDFSITPLQATLVDFGHYNVVDRFSNPLLSLVEDRTLNWGGVMWPADKNWPQPDPAVRVDPARAGPTIWTDQLADWLGAGRGSPTNGISEFAARLARRVNESKPSLDAVNQEIGAFVKALLPT